MERKQGFTLVELLVVMAIIAILASIVLPNVVDVIRKARATRAHSEIKNIEFALTKVLADSDRNSLHELFEGKAVEAYIGGYSGNVNQFLAAQELYTRTLYAILREGRQVLQDSDQQLGIAYANYLKAAVVKKLGTSYMEIGFDPWGNLYQIFPGPWSANTWAKAEVPVIFRSYSTAELGENTLPGTRSGGGKRDWMTVEVTDAATDETSTVGYTAPEEQTVYIWSYGENTINDQALYRVDGQSGPMAYQQEPDQFYYGGGDDVNNWDNERTWERLYN